MSDQKFMKANSKIIIRLVKPAFIRGIELLSLCHF